MLSNTGSSELVAYVDVVRFKLRHRGLARSSRQWVRTCRRSL